MCAGMCPQRLSSTVLAGGQRRLAGRGGGGMWSAGVGATRVELADGRMELADGRMELADGPRWVGGRCGCDA